MMWRKTTCAVGGVVLACVTAYSMSLIAQSQALTNLDLRWLHAPAKGDRLPVSAIALNQDVILSVDLPSQRTTIVTRGRASSDMIESAVQMPRPTKIRTIPVNPVREVPNEESKTEKLPEGCEPAFSPVTTPAYAHISVRCDS